jgi:hypothetical protein
MARRPVTPPPPTMHELMDEPAFAAYVDTAPDVMLDYGRGHVVPHPALTIGNPWMVLVHTTAGTVRVGKLPTYDRALDVFHRMLDDAADVTLVSRRVFFAPPGHWVARRRKTIVGGETKIITEETWTDSITWPGYDWCPRCRRPSLFRVLPPTHHAFKLSPMLTDDDPARCVMCGIRSVALPRNPDLLTIVETS